MKTDVLIVGAGPAGLAAGIAAAARGLSVVIADCAQPEIDKACGEGIMPDGVAALARMGVSIPENAGFPFRGIEFVHEGARATAAFRNGCGLGIRRPKLHQILVSRAREAGASVVYGAKVEKDQESLLIDGAQIECRWIIGADGLKSRVRDWAGITAAGWTLTRFGFRAHYQVEPWTQFVEVNWGSQCEIVVTPVSPSEVCVAMMTRSSELDFDSAIRSFPELRKRLEGATRSTRLRGSLSIQRRFRETVRGKFALIGDASGSVDAITGKGLCLSFQQAECLAQALAKNDLQHYARAHRRIRLVPSAMARLMLSMDRSSALRRSAVRILKSCPQLFSALLETHLGGASVHFAQPTYSSASEFPALPKVLSN